MAYNNTYFYFNFCVLRDRAQCSRTLWLGSHYAVVQVSAGLHSHLEARMGNLFVVSSLR